jgi:ferredoxin-type protein NapF
MSAPTDRGRRAFLGLGSRQAAAPSAIRPPWSSAQSIADHCTRCGDCIAACPERILVADASGAPAVDFSQGGCTFCGACADSCRVPVFDRALAPAWHLDIAISERCLPRHGILCESCRDACGDGAIRFARAAGRTPVPQIERDRCTGCGACASVCPQSAISLAAAGAHGHG